MAIVNRRLSQAVRHALASDRRLSLRRASSSERRISVASSVSDDRVSHSSVSNVDTSKNYRGLIMSSTVYLVSLIRVLEVES